MKYFSNCKTQSDLKKAYREYCKKLHPDNGGSAADFVAMRKEFEEVSKSEVWSTFENMAGETYTKTVNESPAEFMAAIESLVNLPGVVVEICGTWLWISGNTRPYKDIVKQHGGRWSRNKSAWYIHREPFRKKSKRKLSLDEIRALYGRETYKAQDTSKDTKPEYLPD